MENLEEVCTRLTQSQVAEVEASLKKRREWKRGVRTCSWCGEWCADLNEHPCFIAEETAIAFTIAALSRQSLDAAAASTEAQNERKHDE